MNHAPLFVTDNLNTALHHERARLVRLCAAWTGDPHAAEDLAQETLVEAWRQIHKLRDMAGLGAWLTTIARHICARWARQKGRQLRREWTAADADPFDAANEEPRFFNTALAHDDPADIELELERDDLITLLDRALAVLPEATRTVLVAHYLHDSPHAEIAARLGLSENAVAVRVHRGKLALRRVLEQEWATESDSSEAADSGECEQVTRIWCPFCGMQKLINRKSAARDRTIFYCPDCLQVTGTRYRDTLTTLKNPKAVLSRQITWLNDYYRTALTTLRASCLRCGGAAIVTPRLSDLVPAPYRGLGYGVHIECPACDWMDTNTLRYLALDLPETQQFWRAHPRMSMVPERVIEQDNREVVVSTFVGVAENATLEILSVAETLEVIAIQGVPR